MKKTLILLLAVALASLLTACGGAQETELTGEEKDAVLAYSEAMTENMMAGMKAGDYAAFSKDFDQAMLNAMSQEAFGKFKQDYDGKLGAYVSHKVNRVMQSQSGKFVAVVYDAVFEKDDAVIMRVVFRADDPHQISGLWFNK
jgi:major membrane immunogen (membrane-anchored lipoprotein)